MWPEASSACARMFSVKGSDSAARWALEAFRALHRLQPGEALVGREGNELEGGRSGGRGRLHSSRWPATQWARCTGWRDSVAIWMGWEGVTSNQKARQASLRGRPSGWKSESINGRTLAFRTAVDDTARSA